MALLTDDQRRQVRDLLRPFKKLINFLWALIIFSIICGLAARYLWSGYPPVISWLEPWFELAGIFAAVIASLLIARKNPPFRKT